MLRVVLLGSLVLIALTYGVAQLPGVAYQGAVNILLAAFIIVGLLATIGFLTAAFFHWLRSR